MKSFRTLVAKSTEALCQLDTQGFPSTLPMNLKNYFDEELEKSWKGPFTFIQMADPQFGLIEKFIQKKDCPRWDEEMALTTAAIQCINRMRPKPRFVVICGDMLDAHPNDPEEMKLREEQYEDFIETFQQLDPDIPLVCVCGNHDICDVPTPLSYIVYKKQFGPDFFSFRVGGVKFVVVNSQYFKKPESLPKRTEKQLEFLKGIQDDSAKHLVVFQHIPFFVSQPEEEDVSFLNIEREHRFKLMDMLNDAGVNYIFCGHYHRNGGGRYRNFDQVVTSALGGPFGDDPSGFRICHVTDHGIFHQYIPVIIERIPKPLQLKPSTSSSSSRHSFMKTLQYLNPDYDSGKRKRRRERRVTTTSKEEQLESLSTASSKISVPGSQGPMLLLPGSDETQPEIPPQESSDRPYTLQDLLTIRLFHSFSKAFPAPKYWR